MFKPEKGSAHRLTVRAGLTRLTLFPGSVDLRIANINDVKSAVSRSTPTAAFIRYVPVHGSGGPLIVSIYKPVSPSSFCRRVCVWKEWWVPSMLVLFRGINNPLLAFSTGFGTHDINVALNPARFV